MDGGQFSVTEVTDNNSSNKVWEPLLNDSEFQRQIKTEGFFQETKFKDFLKKYSLEVPNRTPYYLSIDFFSKQSNELRDEKKNYYVLRTGQGKFIIFNEKFFSKPYLNLKLENFEENQFKIPDEDPHLIDAYKDRLSENPSLELMHFLGIYKKIIKEVTNENEYHIGPRGNKHSKFEVYLYNKIKKQNKKIYSYDGQEELDYSLFTKNSIFIIEGKSLRSGGLDIGWHKIAYPLSRFKKHNKDIYPCYFLKNKNIIWFFLFPKYTFFEDGILLNDKKAFTPQKVYKIDLNKI